MRVRVHSRERDEDPPIEFSDVEIPVELNPNRLDWILSRPAPLYPWRIRSGNGWQIWNITLIEASIEDFIVDLCGDLFFDPSTR